MDEPQQVKEAVQFFKNEKAYDKLFILFRKKYESLGRIGGTVSTASFNDTELEKIGAFFGQPGNQLKIQGRLSLQKFNEQLLFTKFHSIHLHQLLESYFGEPILSKKEQLEVKQAQLQITFQMLKAKFPALAFWLDCLQKKKTEARWIVQMIEKSPADVRLLLEILEKALNNMPNEAERLPMFSQRITGDPHAFDLQNDLGRMLLHVLTVHQAKELKENSIIVPISTEEINKLLGQYHIYRDDLLNFVTCANLIAETEFGNHPVWEAASQMQTVQIMPLRELIPLQQVNPVGDSKIVYIVENSGVCATLLDKVPDMPIVCTNGQFTLASWMLLEKLVTSGNTLYYAGDFDPEGLQIADRLKVRFGEAIKLWHMDQTAYEKSISDKIISKERLEKLNNLADEQLVEVASSMKQTGKAGYQEALVEWMVEDLKD